MADFSADYADDPCNRHGDQKPLFRFFEEAAFTGFVLKAGLA
jgi:hypothetical protein